MKCPRCQNEMQTLSLGGNNSNLEHYLCFSNGCPISQYEIYKNGDYTGSITFEKYPAIFVETGIKNGKPFTFIKEHYLDDPMSFTNDRVIYQFNVQMMDMTVDRLTTILVFG